MNFILKSYVLNQYKTIAWYSLFSAGLYTLFHAN